MLITRETTPIEQALQCLGLYRFEDKSYRAKVNAQANLDGRTYYVSEDTLRFHNSRILASGCDDLGLAFYIVESVTFNGENTSKRFKRTVVFDVLGNVLHREECRNSSEGIQLAHKYFAEHSSVDHTLRAICERANVQLHRAAKALECLQEVQ